MSVIVPALINLNLIKEISMVIHPFGTLSLNGKNFNVTAQPDEPYPGYRHSTSELVVVEIPLAELERYLANDFEPNTVVEDNRIAVIVSTKTYMMPMAQAEGASRLDWYGNAHCLRALRSPQIACKTVAFVATPSALTILKAR